MDKIGRINKDPVPIREKQVEEDKKFEKNIILEERIDKEKIITINYPKKESPNKGRYGDIDE